MTILAIDTATEVCSVALWQNGLLGESFEAAGPQASRIVLGLIDNLLREHQLQWEDLQMLAFGKGPGTFTGVRVATGLVQGLALGRALPVMGISTLAAIALLATSQDKSDTPVLVAQDARMAELYWGCYQLDASGQLVCIKEDSLSSADHVQLPKSGNWLGAGNAYPLYAGQIEAAVSRTHSDISLIWQNDMLPRASSIAALAEQALSAGLKPLYAADIEPVYLRNQVTQQN